MLWVMNTISTSLFLHSITLNSPRCAPPPMLLISNLQKQICKQRGEPDDIIDENEDFHRRLGLGYVEGWLLQLDARCTHRDSGNSWG